jgi:peroxin-14
MPQVQSSTLQERIQFLQGKGLSEPEIQQALSEAANPAVAPQQVVHTQAYAPAPPPAYARAPQYGFQPFVPPPPEAPKRDWRDIFVSDRSV